MKEGRGDGGDNGDQTAEEKKDDEGRTVNSAAARHGCPLPSCGLGVD